MIYLMYYTLTLTSISILKQMSFILYLHVTIYVNILINTLVTKRTVTTYI